MTSNPKRRGPSLELQRQIDESIASRGRSNCGASNLDGDAPTGAPRQTATDGIATGVRAASEAGIPPAGSQFEYLDHPADIVLHSWGVDLPAALSSLAACMFGYITSLDSVAIDEAQSAEYGTVAARGHDLHSLVYSFLDEWLFNFHDTGFVPREVEVTDLRRDMWGAVSNGRGEVMDIRRHPQGTEVKAITYSGMRVEQKGARCDVYVVVDI